MGLTLKAAQGNQINPWKNKTKVGDFYCHNNFTIWESNKTNEPSKHVFVSFGIRRSDKWQIFPIWDMSNNCQKSYLFGFWKLYFEIGYYR